MEEQADIPKVLEELSRSNSARATSRSEKRKRTALKRLAIVLLLISPLLLGVVFLAYQQWTLRGEMRRLASDSIPPGATTPTLQVPRGDQLPTEQSIIADAGAAPDDEPKPIEQSRLDDEMAQQAAAFDAEKDRLNAEIAHLQNTLASTVARDAREWKLAEAEFLLEMANRRLQTDYDVIAATELLEAADANLRDFGDVDTFQVRQQVAVELSALRKVATLDIESLRRDLEVLEAQLNDLPLKTNLQLSHQSRLAQRRTTATENLATEDGLLDSSLALLASVFVWRKWDESPDLRFPPQQAHYLRHNMNLQLEQARLALMSRQSSVYLESLSAGRVLLMEYFISDSPAAERAITEMDRLLEVDINPVVPDISQSLLLLTQLNATRNRQ